MPPQKNEPLRLRILAKYGTLKELAKQCHINERIIWCLFQGFGCTLENAVQIERNSNGYITCQMIQEHVDLFGRNKQNADKTD